MLLQVTFPEPDEQGIVLPAFAPSDLA
jgi:hypothetical protein